MTDPQYGANPNEDYPPPPYTGGYPPPEAQYPPPEAQYPPPGAQYPPPGAQYPPPGQYPPPPGQYPPPPGQYPPPPGQYPPPPGAYYDPAAPFGRDPQSGEPLSEKSKVIAGLLQLLGLIGLLGIGRIYIGQTIFGIVQLVVCLIITAVTCGVGILVPLIWGIIDAVLMFAGNVRDQQGRPLRDGT